MGSGKSLFILRVHIHGGAHTHIFSLAFPLCIPPAFPCAPSHSPRCRTRVHHHTSATAYTNAQHDGVATPCARHSAASHRAPPRIPPCFLCCRSQLQRPNRLHMHSHPLTPIHPPTHACTHARTHTRTHARTHAHTHIHNHTHTHKHCHACATSPAPPRAAGLRSSGVWTCSRSRSPWRPARSSGAHPALASRR